MFGAKAKGSRLERKVAQKIRRSGLDSTASRMILSGAAFGLETDIRSKLPFRFEIKNQQRVQLWEWWEQAERARKPLMPPVLIIGGNHRPQLSIMLLEDWLDLLTELKDYKELWQKSQETKS